MFYKRISVALSLLLLAACGEPIPPEDCSDNIDNDQDGDADCEDSDCDAVLACQPQTCGNGTLDAGEECDGQNLNNQTCADFGFPIGTLSCDPQCSIDTSGCSNPTCGNSAVEGNEQCDDGNNDQTDGCLNTCVSASCGDGFVQAGVEQCDDGNNDNTDTCLNACQNPSCGDSFVQAGVEGCDDGNQNNEDGCSSSCQLESCGDGIVQAPETCDDQNQDNNDGCLNTCQSASCGDGFVQTNVEQCDDANQDDTDDCLTSCQSASCGDGFLQAGIEGCDDGNTSAGDGCSDTCQVELCGDGLVNNDEECDEASLPTPDCRLDCTINDAPIASPDSLTAIEDILAIFPVSALLTGDIDPDGDALAVVSVQDCVIAGGSCQVILDPALGEVSFLASLNISGAATFTYTVSDGFLTDTALVNVAVAPVADCGDGLVEAQESCDDGATTAGDGCNANCQTEAGFLCTGEPSVCATLCGDNIVLGEEQCDDGNTQNGDGCESDCSLICGEDVPGVVRATQDSATGNCYASVALNTNWQNAESFCESQGGYLVVIESANETTLARNAVPIASSFWIGFNDIAVEAGNVDTNFVKVTGGIIGTGFNNFAPGEPNNSGNVEDCVEIRGNSSDWNDLSCAASVQFAVCEIEPVSCGDNVIQTALGETCDDGSAQSGDGCSSACTLEAGFVCSGTPTVCTLPSCGNGVIDSANGEECDDANTTSGDGCSSFCRFEIGCNPGETALRFTSTDVPKEVSTFTPVQSVISVPTQGLVRKVSVGVGNLTHTFDFDINMFLVSPSGLQRELSTGNGGAGDNYTATLFSDNAGTSITAGSAPFTGVFRPEQSLSSLPSVDFFLQESLGDWSLRLSDTFPDDDDGTLTAWTLLLCVDESGSVCGDGVISGLEQCDDQNLQNSDGCSDLCVFEECGDGLINLPGEECDDGNTQSGDGCESDCTLICGNTVPGVFGAAQDSATGNCYVGVQQDLNWFDAELFCEAQGGYLAVIESASENALARSTTLLPENAWLGFNDIAVEANNIGANFAKVTGGTIGTGFHNFLSGEPNNVGNEDCVEFKPDSAGWNDIPCEVTGSFLVCEIEAAPCGDGVVQAVLGETCDDGNIITGDGCSSFCQQEASCSLPGSPTATALDPASGHCLASFSQALSWPNAESFCESQGGYLVVIESAAENTLARSITNTTLTSWIGFNDIAVEAGNVGANFVKVTGGAIGAGFSAFSTGEPNNAGGNEDCIHFIANNTTWNDASCANQRQVLCEIEANPCGDGVLQAAFGEGCDDGNTTNGDGCDESCAVEFCGDGLVNNVNENCDDANAINNDGCPNNCIAVCGDGIINGDENCDDTNTTNGDGCSSLCRFELSCAPGEVPVALDAKNLGLAIPDANKVGVQSQIEVLEDGFITKMQVGVGNLPHTFISDLVITLISPLGTKRELAFQNGADGDNLRNALFSDAATTTLREFVNNNSNAAQYSGLFRPAQSFSLLANQDFLRENSQGPWTLHVADIQEIDLGTLESWSLLMCVDLSALCTDGIIEAPETCEDGNIFNGDGCGISCTTEFCGDSIVNNLDEECDDGNLIDGDGCSSSCQVELSCLPGEDLVRVEAAGLPLAINDLSSLQSTVNVPTSGTITKMQVRLDRLSHTSVSDLDITLISPQGISRVLASFDGSLGDNFESTILQDGETSIEDGRAPFSGFFAPRQSLTANLGEDFFARSASGTWSLEVEDVIAGDSGSLESWSLSLCVNPVGAICGDGIVADQEECDDGNFQNGDGCESGCTLACGNNINNAIRAVQDPNTGSCYVHVRQSTNWQNAETFCESQGGYLAVLESAPENAQVATTNFLAGLDPWIGLTDITAESLTSPSGYRFITGALVGTGFHGFAATEPNQFGEEDCVHFKNGLWNDAICTINPFSFICELEPDPCGDGVLQSDFSETCDDGNLSDGDGCSSACTIEPGFTCTSTTPALGFPSVCQ